MYINFTKQNERCALDFYHNADRHQLQKYAWGTTIILSGGSGYVVKEYFIVPGGEIAPHCHMESTEHWTILEGAAVLTLDNHKIYMTNGETQVIRLGEYHAMKNVSRYPMHGLMVQCGSNLSIEDVYIK